MNLPTIIVSAVVAAVFIAIVVAEIRRRKKGGSCGSYRCSCGAYSCGSCSMRGICHEQTSDDTASR